MWEGGATTDLLDLVPRFLPLLQLPLGLVQLSEEAGQVPPAAAAPRGQAAEHRRRAGREVAAHKVPDAAGGSVQTWRGARWWRETVYHGWCSQRDSVNQDTGN